MTDKPDLYLIHCHDLGDWLTTYGLCTATLLTG